MRRRAMATSADGPARSRSSIATWRSRARQKTGKRRPAMAKTATAKRAEKRVEPQTAAAWAHGNFHWNELRTRDVERAKRFYKETVGWTFEAMQTPDGQPYWVAMAGGK